MKIRTSRLRSFIARSIDSSHSEFDIGAFRDKSHEAGLDRFNQSGGAIMDDFDGDGLLDIVVTAHRPDASAWRFIETGATARSRIAPRQAGVTDQLGGLVCYQADYNNDGRLDIFIPRGAWLDWPVRPTLLKNNGAGGFTRRHPRKPACSTR